MLIMLIINKKASSKMNKILSNNFVIYLSGDCFNISLKMFELKVYIILL